MLNSLHIENIAIIDQLDVDFNKGFSVLTGETGAGKSIIIGSIELALGGKVDRGFLREGTEESLAELIFSVSENQGKEIEKLGITVEDGEVILSRRMYFFFSSPWNLFFLHKPSCLSGPPAPPASPVWSCAWPCLLYESLQPMQPGRWNPRESPGPRSWG